MTIKFGAAESGGSLTIVESVVPPLAGPGLHRHTLEDELWWVLEGEFRFRAGDQEFRTTTGGMAFGPLGVPHTFQNVADTPGRLLIVCSPGGLEKWFEGNAAMHPGEVDPAAHAELRRACGLEDLGPPLAVSDPLP